MTKRLLIATLCFVSLHGGENRVALITGASRGVGFETAELLEENGFIVYGTIRNLPPQTEKNIHFLQVDLLNENSVQKAVQAILHKEGRIDILINNAGYALVGPVELLTEKEMHDQIEVNFFAPIRFIQAVLPIMRGQKSGRIMNISSTNAFLTPLFGSMYGASKAALESLSEALSLEVQPYNISVSIVEPGLVQTRFALIMGTREIPNDPYRAIIDGIDKEIQERIAHPELLIPSQTSKEIAEFLFSIIQDPHPKLRYQTSQDAKQSVAKKLLDLTGDMYLEEAKKYLEHSFTEPTPKKS